MEKILTEKIPPRVKTQKRLILKAAGQLLPALIGFMLGSVSFDGRIFPFGVAFAGGASDDRLLSVCLGSAAGALVFCPHSAALKYAGACVLLFFLRTSALKNVKETSKPRVYPLLTFACVLICSLVLALAFSTELSGMILEMCDAVIAGTCAFFSYRVFSVVGSGGRFACVTSGDTAALMLWGSLILLSLNKLSIGGFSPARTVTFLCVMLLSFCGKESTGTAAGVCAGTVFGLSDGTPHLLFALPLSGLLCGLCAEYGKPAVAAAFAVSDILALIMKGSADTLMIFAYSRLIRQLNSLRMLTDLKFVFLICTQLSLSIKKLSLRLLWKLAVSSLLRITLFSAVLVQLLQKLWLRLVRAVHSHALVFRISLLLSVFMRISCQCSASTATVSSLLFVKQ